MPREASKLGHRGIGFVTFASPDAVEKLMAQRHTLKGQELAVDRATPKDKVNYSQWVLYLAPPLLAQRGTSGLDMSSRAVTGCTCLYYVMHCR
jgi:hypothetical protein